MDISVKKLPVTLLDSGANDEVTIVDLAGDIDGNTASTVQAQVLPLAASSSRILLNMTKVPYMSSAGLRMLLSVYRQVAAQDGQVVLVGLSEEIQDTMSITGFLDFFTTRNTLEGGCEALKVKAIAVDA